MTKRKILLNPWSKKSKTFLKKAAKRQQRLTLLNPAENWFDKNICKDFHFQFTRQKIFGYRIFDFWCESLRVAVEIDGKRFHKDTEFDQQRDDVYQKRFKVSIFRVKAFCREDYLSVLGKLKSLRTHPKKEKEKRKKSPPEFATKKQSRKKGKNKKNRKYLIGQDKIPWKIQKKFKETFGFFDEKAKPGEIKVYSKEEIDLLQKRC